MESTADVYFDNSPVFKLSADAVANGKIRPLAWFATATPLRAAGHGAKVICKME
jgi:hypothetical protein